jgi:hypothetical protein
MWTDRRTDKWKGQTAQREIDIEAEKQGDKTLLTVAFRYFANRPEATPPPQHTHTHVYKYMAILLVISHIFTIEHDCLNASLAP